MKSQVKTAVDRLETYHLVVQPATAICQQIEAEQACFAESYPYDQTVFERPAILLAQITMRQEMEATIIRWLENISQMQPSFEVQLNNFSGIPEQAIIIRIADKQPLQHILVRLASISEFINHQDGSCVALQLFPCVTLATQLPPELYQKAIADYSKRTFATQFTAQALTLLKKEREGSGFQLCHQFRLCTPRFFAA